MVSLNILTVTLSGIASDYFLSEITSTVPSPAWFNEDESLCIFFLNNRWVIAVSPFNEDTIISEYPYNNWPSITIKENN